MTTNDPLTTGAILNAFATAGAMHALPRAALEQATDRWLEIGPPLLALLQAEANGTDRSDRAEAILFFAIYLMAQRHETQAFQPLCTIAANGERMYDLIGEGLTEDLPGILSRVYDGDWAPLRRLIEAPDADEFARAGALEALARLTATGRIGRDETARYLRDLHATLQPQDQSFVWVGWQQAIAQLGLDDLVPLVEDAFRRGSIGPDIMDLHHFQKDLDAAKLAASPAKVFNKAGNHLDDIAAYLSGWDSFRPDRQRPLVPRANPVNPTTIQNPYRDVGRNDPCPCGSGKKFKKCCLDKVR